MYPLLAMKPIENVELALVLFDFEVKITCFTQLSWALVLTELALG